MSDKQKSHHPDHQAEVPESEWAAALRNVQENPLMYAGAVVLILAVSAFSWYYRAQARQATEVDVTQLARALDEEDRAVRLTLFEALAEEDTHVQAEALYMLGETACELGEYDKAEVAFRRLRDDFPDFYLAPDAAEGLGFAFEAQEKFAEARKEYEHIQDAWPDSFASKRQPLNVGRVLLASGDTQSAIVAFREQLTTFPGSRAAQEAQTELNELRLKQPEFFEDENATADAQTEGLPITLDVSDIVPVTPDGN